MAVGMINGMSAMQRTAASAQRNRPNELDNRKDEKVRTGRDNLVALVTTLPTFLPPTPVERIRNLLFPKSRSMWEVRITWTDVHIPNKCLEKATTDRSRKVTQRLPIVPRLHSHWTDNRIVGKVTLSQERVCPMPISPFFAQVEPQRSCNGTDFCNQSRLAK